MSQKQGSSTALSRGARAGAAADLLADEAKAWRRLAARPSVKAGVVFGYSNVRVVPDRDLAYRMALRHCEHTPLWSGATEEPDRVIAALWFALEAESESRSLRCQGGR